MWYYAVYIDITYQKTWVSINIAVRPQNFSYCKLYFQLISCFSTKYPGAICDKKVEYVNMIDQCC